MYYLYLLQCADDSFYAGITVDLERRLAEHNNSKLGSKYTRARRPVKLVFSQEFKDRSTATKAELDLKKLTHTEKIALISQKASNV
jgi:putative endonuclease